MVLVGIDKFRWRKNKWSKMLQLEKLGSKLGGFLVRRNVGLGFVFAFFLFFRLLRFFKGDRVIKLCFCFSCGFVYVAD